MFYKATGNAYNQEKTRDEMTEEPFLTNGLRQADGCTESDLDGAYFAFHGLSKSYKEGSKNRLVLQNASLAVGQGESIAILGKSGSGKSTLLNLISGIDLPDGGEIHLDGICLSCMNDTERTRYRRKNIGFIFQFFNLIPTLTVWENLVLPLELNERLNRTGEQRAVDLLDQVGLGDRKKTYPDRLSGGEQQRVAIARALVHDPLLILADEPTGNLDEDNGRAILQMLEQLTRRSGKNLVLVTHSVEAAAIADHTYLLRDGRLCRQTRSV